MSHFPHLHMNFNEGSGCNVAVRLLIMGSGCISFCGSWSMLGAGLVLRGLLDCPRSRGLDCRTRVSEFCRCQRRTGHSIMIAMFSAPPAQLSKLQPFQRCSYLYSAWCAPSSVPLSHMTQEEEKQAQTRIILFIHWFLVKCTIHTDGENHSCLINMVH